jgi:PPK2 family polyphosphate:nucleotide phosphotransferase
VNAIRKTLDEMLVEPGKPARLAQRDPAWDGGEAFRHLDGENLHAEADGALARSVGELETAHELLWASGSWALLIVFQAMDAAGKDGTIRHVMSGVNPTGVDVISFKVPTPEELRHDFLWRIAKAMPERGRIAIFNRSHYEEVVTVRVHPELLAAERSGDGASDDALWRERFESINAFEQHAARNGMKIVKLFLHVSKEEQRRRLLARLDEPDKGWKFDAADLADRAYWDQYMAAYDAAITATSTPWAPWHILPADRKPLLRALAATVIVDAINSLKLRWPELSEQQRAENDRARQALEAEGG